MISTNDVVCFPTLQRKFSRWKVARILQCEKKTLQTVIRLHVIECVQLPLHRTETAEDVPFRIQNHSQTVSVTVTSVMKFCRLETIATASP
jgi:hypothetical protein